MNVAFFARDVIPISGAGIYNELEEEVASESELTAAEAANMEGFDDVPTLGSSARKQTVQGRTNMRISVKLTQLVQVFGIHENGVGGTFGYRSA
jgi:hypothetical protein